MKTIHRQKSKYRPQPNNRQEITFLHSKSIVELIKITDDWCSRYGYDYVEPIYKVIESPDTFVLKTPNTSPNRVRKDSRKRVMEKAKEIFYYEAKLRKVVAS